MSISRSQRDRLATDLYTWSALIGNQPCVCKIKWYLTSAIEGDQIRSSVGINAGRQTSYAADGSMTSHGLSVGVCLCGFNAIHT